MNKKAYDDWVKAVSRRLSVSSTQQVIVLHHAPESKQAGLDVVVVPRCELIRLSASMFYSLEARENASRRLLELAGVTEPKEAYDDDDQ
jgi:hypothetical protein